MPHSPLPWTIQDDNRKASDEWSADTDDHANFEVQTIFGGDGRTVCLVVGGLKVFSFGNTQTDANAALISTAPSMLNLLKRLDDADGAEATFSDEIRALIAHAEGVARSLSAGGAK